MQESKIRRSPYRKKQEKISILLEQQNEKQKAILANAYAFAEHDLTIAPSISIQQKNTCCQQDLMYFVCSAFVNMGKKRNDIVSFLYKVFPIYFLARKSVLAKKMPEQEK